MGWVFALGLAALSFLGLYLSKLCSRTALEIAGAAILLAGRRPALAIIGAAERAEAAMAQAVNDALAFSGLPAAALDVMFLSPGDLMAGTALSVGLPVAAGEPETVAAAPAVGPGMDPSRPPRLR